MISLKILLNSKNRFSFFCFAAILLTLTFGLSQRIQAQSSVTFAQFVERNGTQDFTFNNNNGSSASFQTIQNGSPIYFFYQNVPNLPAELQGPQSATLVLSANITQAAMVNGSDLNQPLNNTSIIQIIRDAPATIGANSRRNLLTVAFGPAQNNNPMLNGSSGGNSASFSATTPTHVVTFSSDFIRFDNTTQRNLALSFSSILPNFSLGAGNLLQSFTAAGSGTFAADQPPVFNPPPTAAGMTISGRVTNASGRAIPRARVTMSSTSGASITVLTNPGGFFRFSDVQAGQTYFFTVASNIYRFNEPLQTLFVEDNYSSVNFVANQ